MKDLFYRLDENGNAVIFDLDGDIATTIDANVYHIDSQVSTRYEHPEGIVLTIEDAKKLGIEEELWNQTNKSWEPSRRLTL